MQIPVGVHIHEWSDQKNFAHVSSELLWFCVQQSNLPILFLFKKEQLSETTTFMYLLGECFRNMKQKTVRKEKQCIVCILLFGSLRILYDGMIYFYH